MSIAGLGLAIAAPAIAAPIIGGGTDLVLTSAPTLTSPGLSFTNFGTSSVVTDAGGIPTVTFLITGGSRDDVTGALIVDHAGSGLDFTAGSNSLQIGDFHIDTAAGLVSGTAVANGTARGIVPLFDIGPGLSLLLTSTAAGAFTSVFGAPDLTGATIGTADVNAVFAASAVPEPGAWLLMIGGFGVVGATLRQRKRTIAVAA